MDKLFAVLILGLVTIGGLSLMGVLDVGNMLTEIVSRVMF
jgi:hypothetical protein